VAALPKHRTVTGSKGCSALNTAPSIRAPRSCCNSPVWSWTRWTPEVCFPAEAGPRLGTRSSASHPSSSFWATAASLFSIAFGKQRRGARCRRAAVADARSGQQDRVGVRRPGHYEPGDHGTHRPGQNSVRQLPSGRDGDRQTRRTQLFRIVFPPIQISGWSMPTILDGRPPSSSPRPSLLIGAPTEPPEVLTAPKPSCARNHAGLRPRGRRGEIGSGVGTSPVIQAADCLSVVNQGTEIPQATW
jgi:hypothetical protein